MGSFRGGEIGLAERFWGRCSRVNLKEQGVSGVQWLLDVLSGDQ